MSSLAQQFGSEGRLVVFAGAGVSAIAPTCLPSWWGMNQAVVRTLSGQAEKLVGAERAIVLGDAITRRQEANVFPPEYQAEVIVRTLRKSYFKVLQVLDSDIPNDVHLAIAALARDSAICAVITTNFDRALEAAFRQTGIGAEVFSEPQQFELLAKRLEDGVLPKGARPILKLHGSAEKPDTLIDTLSQRKRGFHPAVARCVRSLLRGAHWLFLGYSGADLMADRNYLFLKPDAEEAVGFTWLVRNGVAPFSAVTELKTVYGDRGDITRGELPEWMTHFSEPLLTSAAVTATNLTEGEIDQIRNESAERVSNHVKTWAGAERFDRNVLVLADLLDAVGEPEGGLEIREKLVTEWPPEDLKSGHFGVAVNSLGNAYSQASRFEDAKAMFERALPIFAQRDAQEQYLGTLNNLALVCVKQGKTMEALQVYKQVLEFAESRGMDAERGVALHNLGMTRRRLGEDTAAKELYLEELELVKELGDEVAEAVVLNNLGELEIAKGQIGDARDYLERAKTIRERLGDDLGVAHIQGNLANAHLGSKEYDEALELYGAALTTFGRFSDRANYARTLANMASANRDLGHGDEAMALLKEALREANKINSDVIRVQVIQSMGELNVREGRPGPAAEHFKQALELAVRVRDARAERDAQAGYGIAAKDLEEFDDAITALRQAQAGTGRFGFQDEWRLAEHLGDALNRRGLMKQESGDTEGALADFSEAVKIWESERNPFFAGLTWTNVGNTRLLQKRHAEAAEAFLHGESAHLRAEKSDEADGSALMAGHIYLALGELDSARAIFRRTIVRARDYETRADTMNKIGRFIDEQLQQGAVGLALDMMSDCARWNFEDGYFPDAAACQLNIGHILRQAGNIADARRVGSNAAELLKNTPDHRLVEQVNEFLGSLANIE
jgi:tetratricopeptide (TPR) repeat protein